MQLGIKDELEKLVREATENPTQQIPGLVFQCVNRDGDVVCSTSSGIRGLDDPRPMTTDTLFWIASCTKLITAIALMQLVEQGAGDLDSSDLLENVLPELKTVKILGHEEQNGVRVLTEKTKNNRITLRMLATHTGTNSLIRYHALPPIVDH
jgi:CubicO group peptidase (beta-lactamase class C family)